MSFSCAPLCRRAVPTSHAPRHPLRLFVFFFSSRATASEPPALPHPLTAAPPRRARLTVTETPPPLSHSLISPSAPAAPRSLPPKLPPASPPRAPLVPSPTSPRAPSSLAATNPLHRSGSVWLRWLARKLGYDELRPIMQLYASASSRVTSAVFTSPRGLHVADTVDGHCALLTLHVWLLHCRLREAMYQSAKLGAAKDAKQWKKTVHTVFELYWQEMDTLVRGEEEEEGDVKDAEVAGAAAPARVFTAGDYTQLAYGAMVSYDRAWTTLRRTGQKTDLMGALWRNVHVGKEELSEAHLQRLLRYTEQMKQRSNRWTEAELKEGSIDWGPLPAEEEQAEGDAGLAVLLRYQPEVYDGSSRVREGESMGVPVRLTSLFGRGNDDLMAVADDTSQLQQPANESSLPEHQQHLPRITQLTSDKADEG